MSWAWRTAVSAGRRFMATIPSRLKPLRWDPAEHLLCNVVPQSVVLNVSGVKSRSALFPGALAVLATRPAAGPAEAFLEFLLGPADAALSGRSLFGVIDPADELVARQGRDVLPSGQCRRIGKQRLAQVCGQLVHHSARSPVAAHGRQRNPEHGR